MYQERSLGRLDEDSVLPYVANQALLSMKELGPDVVLYGIHKKGASLLEDIATSYPFIGEHTIVYDNQVTARIVAGRDVLIIDDSIHRGEICQKHVRRLRQEGAKRVALFVVVSSRDGLAAARTLNVPITSVVEVSEKLFTLAFGLLMVPMLGLFRNGALSNRPHRAFRIDAGSLEAQGAALKCLRVLSSVPCLTRMAEVPSVDGRKAIVYAARTELSTQTLRQLRAKFAPYGSIDQAKFRIFLSRLNGSFHLCICAIVWPIGTGRRAKEEIQQATDDTAAWLLDVAEEGLKMSFAGTGFHLTRTDQVLRTASTAPGRRSGSSRR
jgi:hypothetical protein